jgi:hypothetical protein
LAAMRSGLPSRLKSAATSPIGPRSRGNT